jgi:dCTP deaminase
MPGDGIDCPYQTSAVDLRLGSEISFFKQPLPLNINLLRGGFAHLFGPNSKQQTITEDQPFVLKPGRLILGRTLETVGLPIIPDGTCLAARVEGKALTLDGNNRDRYRSRGKTKMPLKLMPCIEG